jgi:hypothetical protein
MQRCTPYAAAVRHADCTAERSRDSVLTGSHSECGALHRRGHYRLCALHQVEVLSGSADIAAQLGSADHLAELQVPAQG